MKKLAALALLLGLAASCLAAAKPKYVFLFIGDGMSTPQRMTAEEFSRAIGNGPLAMNALRYQSMTRTRAANAVVTDSAAAATAIACGEKADNGALGLKPDGTRLESVAEFAKRNGKKVGVMTTVPIVHATPAGFYAHRRSRGDNYGIALDLLASGFDYFAGGGVYDDYDDKAHAEYRGNVFALAAKDGYAVVRDKAAFSALKPGCGKVWAAFGDNGLPFAIDDAAGPTLADMVAKAVELLDGPDGFFLMAEGGKVDYGAHANDAATLLREVLSMDDAVRVAAKFMERHPDETLVVVTGDHETGGMAMGFAGIGYNFHVQLLKYQKCSAEVFSNRIAAMLEKNPDLPFEAVKPLVEADFGLLFSKEKAGTSENRKKMVLSASEVKELEKAYKADVEFVRAKQRETKRHDVARRRKFAAACRRLVSNHAGVGWSSGAHTAMPTMTTAGGCGAENFSGYLDNTDIARILKDLLAK